MKYCSECGAPVDLRPAVEGAGRRFVCRECKRCYFVSPRLAASCLVEVEGRILLCRRAVEPDVGLWSLPGGFVENAESAANAGVREVIEEAGMTVEIQRPYAMFHAPNENLVQVVYLARALDERLDPGPESLEARLFGEDEIPWTALAMSLTRVTLRRYFEDIAAGDLGFLFVELMPFPH